ncbi:hypothetical protein [Maridesulfovibrio frigidus]|uniref:hypothetical protein n=1 Tax=Maridesulfovibrio frigidus TaxID=340956 RepID=UPI0004E1E480|nr:hypothetical protein [Maridesulfovibrio frigidus]
MKSNALYYPYINVPDAKWLYKVLLYWDKVMSIVPMEYYYHPDMYTPFMLQLVRNELVVPVTPAGKISSREFDKFFHYAKRTVRKKGSKFFEGKRFTAQVHMEKLGDLGERLVEIGVAKSDNYPWYEMPRGLANHFMSFIALNLSRDEDIMADPVTYNGYPIQRLRQNFMKTQVRNELLDFLLPVPDEHISIDDVLFFKMQHGDLLTQFRIFVEREVDKICSISDIECEYEEIIDQSKSIFAIKSAEIEDALRSRWKKIAFQYVIPLFSVGVTCSLDNPSPFIAAAGTIAPMFASNCKEVSKEPMAYSVFAKRTF